MKIRSLICLMLAAIMLVCAPMALADAPTYALEDAQDYTAIGGTFTCQLPADYIVASGQTAETFGNLINVDTFTSQGATEEEAQQMLDALADTDFSQMDMVFTADCIGNINVQVVSESGLTPAIMEMAVSMLDQQLISTYVQMGAAEEGCIPQGMITVGSNPYKWYGFYVDLMGTVMHQYMVCTDEGTMYTLTFSNIPEEEELAIVESFAIVEA